jgi:hypothetical protein
MRPSMDSNDIVTCTDRIVVLSEGLTRVLRQK